MIHTKDMGAHMTTKTKAEKAHAKQMALVAREGSQRIAAYREFQKKYCIDLRPLIKAKLPEGVQIDRMRFRPGTVVTSDYAPGTYLVVGHSYTGKLGNERGCEACEITDRIHKRWRWIGPESMIRAVKTDH